ncbi:MAG: roadblock/LC7 domain-containing protein [candidate division WOR-3 bacterium]
MKKLVLDEPTVRDVERFLKTFIQDTKVLNVLIINSAGQVLFQMGMKKDNYYTQSLGALCAGIFNATKSIAKLVREDYFFTLFQEGKKFSFFYLAVNDEIIIVSLFSKDTIIGVVQTMMKKLSENIVKLMKEEGEEKITFDRDFKNQVDNIIDNLFR